MNIIAASTAFLFPGQGSQVVGMGKGLAEAFPIANETYAQADQILGFPLSILSWEGPEEILNDTVNTQPALLVHSVAALRVFNEIYPGFLPAYVAGHSMGELSALVAAKALSYEDTLRLVRQRGELMKKAGTTISGGMAAIMGLDIPTLEMICKEASPSAEIVQIANDNCPGQVVISGAKSALEKALVIASERGAQKVVPLAVSIAAHSPLMAIAQAEFNQTVSKAPIINPSIPIVGNVSAQPLLTAGDIRADLQAQLSSRVRWTETIQFLLAQGVTTFIELGTGKVLTGLLKRIDRQATRINLGIPEDFQ
jgi:[acyl-carrier-protein] S-malonyltransferase